MIKWHKKNTELSMPMLLLVNAVLMIACGYMLFTMPEPKGCDKQDIIVSYFERVLEDIHGAAFRPELMPPKRKPV